MSVSKIEIKVGIVEFSGEGDEKWLAEQFDKMLSKVPELLKIEVSAPPAGVIGQPPRTASPATGGTPLNLSMINIAAKINDKSGPGLATAASAFLRFVQQKPSFSRDEINKAMKDATGYFQKNYTGNLTKILKALVSNNTLNQNSDNKYSLHVDKENELNVLLAK